MKKYDETKQNIKPKSKYLDPIKNNSYGDKVINNEKVVFKPVNINKMDVHMISYDKEYTDIYDFLTGLNIKGKVKKDIIIDIWVKSKSKFSYTSLIILFDAITEFYNYPPKKLFDYLGKVDKINLWKELNE